jgi:hypothetical protein
MTPEEIAQLLDGDEQVSVSDASLMLASRILENVELGEAVVFEGEVLLPADDWRYGDEVVLWEVAQALDEAKRRKPQRGRIEKDESRHFSVIKGVADRITKRAEEYGFPAEVISSGDVHAHPFVVEIQVGKNRLFQQSQWISVTIYDTDDLSVELPNEIAAMLGRGNTIVKDKPSALAGILGSLENKVKEAGKENPPTWEEKKVEAAERRREKEEGPQECSGEPEDQPEDPGRLSLKNRLDAMKFVRAGTKPPRMGGTFAPA